MNPHRSRRSSPGVFSTEGAAWAAVLVLGLLLYWQSGADTLLQWPPNWPGLLGAGIGLVATMRICRL